MVPVRRSVVPRSIAAAAHAAAAAALLATAPLLAQRPEFTRQSVLVTPFHLGDGATTKMGKAVAGAMRDQGKDRSNGRETEFVSSYSTSERLERAGYSPDSAVDERSLLMLARNTRADEYVVGTIARRGDSVEARAELRLTRDARMRQPLPTVVARDAEAAGRALGAHLAAARVQMYPLRRCENALRDGKVDAAIAHAAGVLRHYPDATLTRACHLTALRARGASAAERLAVAREVLARLPDQAHALDAAATAYDALGRRDEAAAAWTRLARTDSTDVELHVRVLGALLAGGNAATARPLVAELLPMHPEELELYRLRWRAAMELRDWPFAVAAGEALVRHDSLALRDPMFIARLATAYRENGQPFHAIRTIAGGVAEHGEDARLYAVYAQLLLGEADTVLARGLAKHPRHAPLLALNASVLRRRGQLREAAAASRQAADADGATGELALMHAQTEFELGRPDSALLATRRALALGETPARVARFALARGSTLLREAADTTKRTDPGHAVAWLQFADSLAPTPQTKFFLGSAGFGALRALLPELNRNPKEQSPGRCELVRRAQSLGALADLALTEGEAVSAEAAGQIRGYLGQLGPYLTQQSTIACGVAAPGGTAAALGDGAAASPR